MSENITMRLLPPLRPPVGRVHRLPHFNFQCPACEHEKRKQEIKMLQDKGVLTKTSCTFYQIVSHKQDNLPVWML